MLFVRAFKKIDLVENCFSTHKFDKVTSRKQFDNLRKAAAAVEISESHRLHISVWHIEDCLGNLVENKGLGLW